MHQPLKATYAATYSRANTARTSLAPSRSPLQARIDGSPRQVRQLQKIAALQRKIPQQAGDLPAKLQAGIEQLSGLSLDGVKVHYNSSKPAQISALAYAQGTDIYLGPGQERHLPHEAWHVVQQKQGRVRPTLQVNGTAVNDNPSLEREADLMGMRASR